MKSTVLTRRLSRLSRSCALPAAALLLALSACNAKSEEEKNSEVTQQWIDQNTAYFNAQADLLDSQGGKFYERLVPEWNSGASMLIHWFNDRDLTAGNLRPMLTSTVQVKYEGRLIDGEVFDDSYSNTDSLFTTKLTDVVEGWTVALCNMNVGDSVRVVIPAGLGYGATGQSSIPAYSTLEFDIKLVKVSAYELP